jgi:parallel beta-helix repeat protein
MIRRKLHRGIVFTNPGQKMQKHYAVLSTKVLVVLSLALVSSSVPPSLAHSQADNRTLQQKAAFKWAYMYYLMHHHHWPSIQQPAPSKTTLNAKSFGVMGDGVTDDQNAITQALASAKSQNANLYFPPGNYIHSSTIVIDSVYTYGAGSSTMLTATTASNGAVELIGNSPSLNTLVVQYQNPSTASSRTPVPDTTPQESAVWVQSATNFGINQITINNSSENALDVIQSNNGTITNNQINETTSMWDGLQIADSNNVQIENNSFSSLGQNCVIDCVPISTGSQAVTIANNQISLTEPMSFLANAIAINISALSMSTISGNSITGTSSPEGIKLNSGTAPGINQIQIEDNTLSNLGQCVSMNGSFVTNIQITGNTMTNSGGGVSIDYNCANITISSNAISNMSGNGIFSFDCDNITIQNNIISNITYNAVLFNATYVGTGAVTVSSNTISNCVSGLTIDSAVLFFFSSSGQFTALTITNNTYSGPANDAAYYIDCQQTASGITRTISGNTTSTLLPNNIVP